MTMCGSRGRSKTSSEYRSVERHWFECEKVVFGLEICTFHRCQPKLNPVIIYSTHRTAALSVTQINLKVSALSSLDRVLKLCEREEK